MKTKQIIIVSLMICFALILNLARLNFASGIIVYALFESLLEKKTRFFYHVFLFSMVIQKAINYWFKYQQLFDQSSVTKFFSPLFIVFLMIAYYGLSLMFELVVFNFILSRIGLKQRFKDIAKRFI